MSTIYKSLSELYEMMYQTFINYDEEYLFYAEILNEYKCRSLVELGCGSGNLASRFVKNGYQYTGLDASEEMLKIAKAKSPEIEFVLADMRDFQLKDKKDACILTGRTVSYLITDRDMVDCFNSINRNLKNGGMIVFDAIESDKFIPTIINCKQIVHHAEYNDRKFRRTSFWSYPEINEGVFNWKSIFFEEKKNGDLEIIGQDESVLRSFSKAEMSRVLEHCNFSIQSIEERSSYAFDTFVIVAQKNS